MENAMPRTNFPERPRARARQQAPAAPEASTRGGGLASPRRRLSPALLLLLVGLAVFLPAAGHDFLNLDDDVNIYRNPLVLDWSLDHLRIFWQAPHKGLYIPLTYTLWSLLALASSCLAGDPSAALSPLLFHASNIVLHLATALILAAIFRLLLGNAWAAGLGALFFAIHPVQVEAVAWVTGGKDLLSGFFSVLALWQYLLFAHATEGGKTRFYHHGLATLFFVAAFLAKPGAVALPLVAALLVRLTLARPWRQLALELSPWLFLSLVATILAQFGQPQRVDDFIPAFGQRFIIAGDALRFYAGKIFFPLSLAADYGRSPTAILAQKGVKIAALLPYLLLPALCWKAGRPLRIASGIFLLALLPVLGFVPFHFQAISTVADRYLYLAMIGPAYLFAWLLANNRHATAKTILLGVLVILTGLSMKQIQYWRNPMTLNSHILTVNPRSWLAYLHRGLAREENREYPAAIEDFHKALEFNRYDAKTHNYLGIAYSALGQEREAEKYYEKAIALNPRLASAYFNLGLFHARRGNPEEAIVFYREALALSPAIATEQGARGRDPLLELAQREYASSKGKNLHIAAEHDPTAGGTEHQAAHRQPLPSIIAKALAYESQGKFIQAIAMYKQAIKSKHDLVEAYNNLGVIYRKREMMAAAEHFYKKAIALKPDFAEAHNNLGDLYLSIKREKEAIPLFLHTIAMIGAHPTPWNNLGKAYAATGNQEDSIAAYQKAISLDPSFAEAYNNLSILHLQSKQIALALEYGSKAKELGFVDPAQESALQKYR